MIKYFENGNIFNSKAKVLVNPVNKAGVMGAGLAKEFANRFPNNYRHHRQVCASGKILEDSVSVYEEGGKIIFNLPTKHHWRDNTSDIVLIHLGLVRLREHIKLNNWGHIAVPALGCGLGKLPWSIVKDTIAHELERLDVLVEVYEPWNY